MALANLTINVTANAAPAQRGLEDVGATAKRSMQGSAAAVDDFRTRLLRASDDLQVAAHQMSGGFEAANDAMVRDSKRTEQAVDALTDKVANVKFDSFSEKMASAFGVAAGTSFAAAKTWMEKTEDYVKAKATGIAIVLAIGIVSATAAAIYTSYKLITGTYDFIKGLFTGDSYKSANIDALIAINKEVKDLQESLYISAQHASALHDALDRLGVSKSDYTTAFTSAEKAMRSNGEELDRLGVKYKSADGKLLETQEFLQNVKGALDQYTEGYDRNAAAAAIGAGSYSQVVNALKVTRDEIALSKDRLDEYGLAIGPQTQAYVEQYEKAMREFKHESDLTSQGFKRAIADNIMPILTDLAVFFKDGFPTAVRAFRYTMAEVTSLFYGLKTSTYIVAESILGLIQSIGLGIGGVGSALIKVFQGDFAGAKESLFQGWEDAKKRFGQIGDNIVTQALHNRDAIIQAWGLDDRTEMPTGSTRQQGKRWTPKPDADEPAAAAAKSPYQSFLEELDRMVKKTEESEYAMLRLKASQLGAKEGIKDLTGAYEKINALQRGESQKVVDDYIRKVEAETDGLKFQSTIMGLTAHEQDKLTYAREKYLEVERLIEAAKKSGKPLDDKAIADLNAEADAAIRARNAVSDQIRSKARDPESGFNKAINDYIDAGTNMAEQVKNSVTNGLNSMEDALVSFAKTGKLTFRDLFSTISSDLTRIFIRQNITSPLAGMLTWSNVSKLFGFADGGDPPVGVPSMVGERGPELFVPKQAGTIIPNHQLASMANGGGGASVVNNYFTVGDVASVSMVRQAIAASESRSKSGLMRSRNYGGLAA